MKPIDCHGSVCGWKSAVVRRLIGGAGSASSCWPYEPVLLCWPVFVASRWSAGSGR